MRMSRAFFSAAIAFGLAGCATGYQLPASDAEAVGPFGWCADFQGDAGTNCGYVTLEQCRAAIGGVGGQCSPNPARSTNITEPEAQ